MLLLLAFPLFFAWEAGALPLPNGSTAPNFTLTDLNGVSHTLYNYLDQGYTVVIDFSATWCGPCWNYHNTHILADLWNQKGPPGTDEVMVFFIEGDPSTPVSALYGGSGSQGNWVDGTPYPIMDDGSGQVASNYQITFFPTLYAICPNRKIYTVGQASLQTWINWIGSCSLDVSALVDNADCFGQPGGSIDVTATGGFGNKTYQWSNGANTQDVFNLMPGNYSVTVTEGQGHSLSLQNLVVTSPPAINVQTLSVTNVACNGAGNGSATVSASGGVPGFTYSWSNGSSGPTATNLSGGMHQVSVHDGNNCLKVHSVMITEPQPLNGNPQVTGANCGNSDGSAIITPSGGTFPYSFNIGNGPTSIPVFTGLAAGSYTVTMTDGNNCQKLVPFTVANIPGPIADAGPSQMINCTNSIVVLDGTNSSSGSNITYLWTTTGGVIVSGANTATPTVAEPGIYEIRVTNTTTGCVSTDDVVVMEDTALPTADAGAGGEIDCVVPELTLDGTASSQGGQFTYSWTTTEGNIVSGENTLNPVVDAGGTYTLTVVNTSNTCSSTSSVEVEADLNAPVSSGGPDGVINCNASEVTLNGTGSSEGSEITYQWTTVNGNILSGENTLTPVVDAGGDYVLLVTNTTNGCAETDEVVVTEDLATPVADAGPDGVLNCNTNSLVLDGSASSTGGQFQYLWTTADGNIASGENTLTPTVDQAGTYQLQVSNTGNGCISTGIALVIENITVEGAVEDITPVSCAGAENGSATVTAAQGVEPYVFSWPGGLSGPAQTGLAAGTYNVTVTDGDNCTDLINVVVTEPAALVANASATGETSLGANDGVATANPAGGTDPYTFLWNNGETTESISGLQPGSYTVIITDANNCSTQETVTVNSFTCTINASVTAQQITCNGSQNGAATVNINNGLEPYNIVWSNGTEGPSATGLAPGTYTVSITDENNCPTTANVTIQEPAAVALTIVEVQNALCFGDPTGQATVEASGGVGGYSYLWPSGNTEATETSLGAGTYQVTLSDANGCETTTNVNITQPQQMSGNVSATGESAYQSQDGGLSVSAAGGNPAYQYLWSTGETTASISGLAPGEYTVVITDENGCDLQLTGTVQEYICPEVAVVSTIDNVSCAGLADGEASLSTSGGTAPYEYTWSNGLTGPVATSLAAGFYEVAVQDGANCPYTVVVEVTEPEVLNLEATEVVNIECEGQTNGSATVAGIGGTPVYSYVWSTSATGASAEGLTPGFHQVTVTDANGCTASLEVEIVVADDETAPTIVIQELILALDENGQAGLTPAMIDAGSYDNCEIAAMSLSQTAFDCSHLGPQEVTLTVTDVNFNESSATTFVTIVDETAPTISCPENIVAYNCDGFVEYDMPEATDNCAVAVVELAGGLGSGANFPLGVTTEVYKAFDASGNAVECSFTVSILNTLETSPASTPTCPEASEGAASVEVAGGTPGYTYLWNTGDETPSIEGVPAGIYQVVVKDATGCEFTVEIEVEAYPAVEITEVEVTPAQNGDPNGSIQITVSNGTAPFTFEWRDQENYLFSTQEDLVNALPGTYVLTIIDANGCIYISDPIEVENISGTNEPLWAAGVWVYPNPAKDQVNVRISLATAASVQLQVFDLKGVEMALRDTDQLSHHELEIASGQWPAGVYYIRLVIGGEVLVRRVVVE